jgi:predicted nucleotidyltransferase/DNA-binding XRE family transcriptional regulator
MTISAADTILDARRRSGLTQAELGARARVAQSVVSAYESGSRQPGVEMIRKLVNAAGFELTLGLTRRHRSRLQRLVDSNRRDLVTALTNLGASNIRVFGSVARGDDGPDSDIDLLVDVDNSTGLFALGTMRSTAEAILGNSVDVVPANSLKPDAADRILSEAVPL